MESVPLDETTVERLLAGRLGLEDVPQGLVGVAALFRAAAGEAIPAELVHEAEVVASGIAVLSAAGATDPFQPAGRKNRRRSKLLTARLAAITTATALGLGAAAAAATGSLPGQDSSSSNPPTTTTTVQTTGAPVTSHTTSTSHNSTSHNSTSLNSTSHNSTSLNSTSQNSASQSSPSAGSQGHGRNSTPPSFGSSPTTGPANAQAQFGLCTAFLAGNKSSSTSVSPHEAIAFRNLIAEHGPSVSQAAVFCQTVVKTHNATGHNTSQNAPNTNDNGQPSGTGKGSGPGNHSSAGNQSNAGSSSSRGQSSNAHSGGSNSAGSDNGVTTATTSGHGHSLVTGTTGQR